MVEVHTLTAGLGYVHIVRAPRATILVDTGSRGQEHRILARLRAAGSDHLQLIVITHAHFDHYGSAAALRELTGAPVAVHGADAEAMARGQTRLPQVRGVGRLGRWSLRLGAQFLRPRPLTADIELDEGDRLDRYGLEAGVLWTPGHTPGSLSLLVPPGLAFVGDLISTHYWIHAQQFYADDWARLAASLARIKALHPQRVYPGHGRRSLPDETLQRLHTPRVRPTGVRNDLTAGP